MGNFADDGDFNILFTPSSAANATSYSLSRFLSDSVGTWLIELHMDRRNRQRIPTTTVVITGDVPILLRQWGHTVAAAGISEVHLGHALVVFSLTFLNVSLA